MINFLPGINYIDVLIVLVLIYFATEAWRHGFWVILADFISFLGAILLSLRFYKFTASFLEAPFALSSPLANALGFLLTAILSEAILGFILGHLIGRLPEKFWKNKFSRFLALLPALGEGVILISFLLTLIVAFPIKQKIKTDILNSQIGNYFLRQTAGVEKTINEVFGGAIEESLTYFTVKPDSKEVVKLNIEIIRLDTDSGAEKELFDLVNVEREKAGKEKLAWNNELANVARAYAQKMWKEKFFGHFSPEGESAVERLKAAKINYTFMGENLALAPTVKTALDGLMSSEGHRENILESNFKKIGIGVVDNQNYGKMFVQLFTD